mgnify:CR=1 FL=1
MSLIQSFYKTKALVNNGIFIILCALFLLIAGYFIPDFTGQEFKEQIYTLNGFNTKHNDPANVSDFYLSIKRNNGFLILGTSESTTIKGGNYYDFLNNDKYDVKKFDLCASFDVKNANGKNETIVQINTRKYIEETIEQ